MIYTVLADISEFSGDAALPLSNEISEHITSAKNEELRRERTAAYFLLSEMTKKLFGKNPKISWAQNGKPKYEGEEIYFNLSHSKNMVAVALCDECAVGVDIEEEIEKSRAERLDRRFFSGLAFSESPLSVKYIFCKLKDGGGLISLDSETSFSAVRYSDSFSARWTLYEAAMKSGGGGFASLPCLDMLLLETCADIKKITIKDAVYYVATASSK